MILTHNNRIVSHNNVILNYLTKTVIDPIITDGLVLNLDVWDLSSYSGIGSAWFDISENTNNATKVQEPTFVDSTQKYFQLDGGSITATGQVDSFSIPDNSTLDQINAITIEMWININSIQSVNGANMLFSKRTINISGYVGFFTSRSYVFRIGTTSPSQLSWSTTPQTNVWQQLVITVASGGSKIYHNSNEVVSSAYAGNFNNINTNANLLIGDINPDNSGIFGFLGGISIFRIYNRVLDSSEVLWNYNINKEKFNLT